MPTLLRMPELAANTPEALLAAWLVEENVKFSASTAIATVETDKAAVDIEADTEGVIAKFLVEAGADVAVGAPIALLAAPDEVVNIEGALAALGVAAGRDTPPAAPVAPPARNPSANGLSSGAGSTGSGRVFASPLARRMARQAGLPCADIAGSGPGGRIVRADVERVINAMPPKPAEARMPVEHPGTGVSIAAPPTTVPASPARDFQSSEATYIEIPHSRMRRAIATALTESKRTAPHFYLSAVADVGNLVRLRERINETSQVRISVNDLVIMAVAKAHMAVPRMNVTWTEQAVRQYSQVDIAVAVSTGDGLLTPVVYGCDQMVISTLAHTTKDFAERARAGRIRPIELRGGTITVSNLGMFGTLEFAAVINPPQAAILAVGAITQEVAWAADTKPGKKTGGKAKLRAVSRMRMTLSVDHRPVDGAVAAEWMRQLVGLLENPLRILL